MRLIKNKNKGFTLVELILTLSVSLGITFMSFQQMLLTQESTQAKIAGQQIKQIGDSVNSYIAVHYDKMASLSNSTGSSTDPGPRTCSTSSSTCIITVQTLINEGLLPTTYTGKNIFNSEYSIVLRRSGSAPYYNVTGMITTNNAWNTANNRVRYDLLGRAMDEAGIDSGMSRDSASIINGYKGSWVQKSSDYSNISKLGQLGFQAGYGSYSYSIYLRRDGTLPMTGNLNMGAQNINNAKDINGSGNLTMSGTGTFGGEVTATNGYGDKITVGGDAASNDYELRLGSAKQLTVYSPNAAQYSTVLRVNRNTVINERMATNGYDPNDVPTGFGGGLRTLDVVSSGTVGVIKSGSSGASANWAAYMTNTGTIYASGNINADGTVNGAYLKATTTSTLGATCSNTGSISKDSTGKLLSCVSGRWSSVDNSPVGSIVIWGSTSIPTGWLECNGQGFNKSTYPTLAQYYPSGAVPDFRGYFLRGLDRGVGRDPDSGRGILSVQQDALQEHSHIAGAETAYHDSVPNSTTRNTPGGEELRSYADRTGGVNTSWNSARTSSETRPKNVAVIYIIKAQ